jgi:hypothetical protein
MDGEGVKVVVARLRAAAFLTSLAAAVVVFLPVSAGAGSSPVVAEVAFDWKAVRDTAMQDAAVVLSGFPNFTEPGGSRHTAAGCSAIPLMHRENFRTFNAGTLTRMGRGRLFSVPHPYFLERDHNDTDTDEFHEGLLYGSAILWAAATNFSSDSNHTARAFVDPQTGHARPTGEGIRFCRSGRRWKGTIAFEAFVLREVDPNSTFKYIDLVNPVDENACDVLIVSDYYQVWDSCFFEKILKSATSSPADSRFPPRPFTILSFPFSRTCAPC